MNLISPKIHRVLDYSVGAALLSAPIGFDFAATSAAAAIISIAAGAGLVLYSLLTDYSAGVRRLISFRTHLRLDVAAGLALVAAPFLVGFGGAPRAFLMAVGVADLLVVFATQELPHSGLADSVVTSAETA